MRPLCLYDSVVQVPPFTSNVRSNRASPAPRPPRVLSWSLVVLVPLYVYSNAQLSGIHSPRPPRRRSRSGGAAERSAIDCALAVTPPSRSVIRFAPPCVCPNGHLSRLAPPSCSHCKDGPRTNTSTSSPASMSAKPDSNAGSLVPRRQVPDRDFANTLEGRLNLVLLCRKHQVQLVVMEVTASPSSTSPANWSP